MATKTKGAKTAAVAPAKGKDIKKNASTANAAPAKGKETDAEKTAKRAKRMEAIKNRPEGQRPNSKTIDVIQMENGSRVEVYAQPVRKFGVIITSVVIDADGNAISTSTTTLAGYRARSKKGHGTLSPGAPGTGKKDKAADEEEGEDDTEEEDGEED